MTVSEYVNNVLCVPVTRCGNIYIVEAIELVLDTRDNKFYSKLADIHETTPKYLEKAMRDAKSLGMLRMDKDLMDEIFGTSQASAMGSTVATGEYIIKAAEYYRRTYEDEK